jgi:hypothetical protein
MEKEKMTAVVMNAIWTELHCQAKDFASGKMTIAQAQEIVEKVTVRVVESLEDTNVAT